MMFPTIHLNGTSREELEKHALETARAVHVALRALELFCPNGRDYYVQGPEAINAALREHNVRVNKLREVYADLEKIALHCLIRSTT